MTYKHKIKHKVETVQSTKTQKNKNEFLAHIAHAKLKKIWSRIDKNDTKTDGTHIYNNNIINNYTVFKATFVYNENIHTYITSL